MALSCSKFDDSAIWDKLTNHESRISELERICKEMNAQIINLQTIVTALENNDYIISASPLVTGDGYTFIFKSGKSVVIYNGKDGVNGTNGTNGTTPQIGVKQDTDGYYYWTVDGEWLIVDGNKVRASAMDGTDGTNGVTPKFKIEDGNWFVSYDNGDTWEIVGRATGNDGIAGENGDSLFKRVYIEDGYVCFELNDDANTVIRIPLLKDGALMITLEQEGTLSKILSAEQLRTTTSLVLKGKANREDMKTIQIMNNLQMLDLSKVDFIQNKDGYGGFKLNPYKDTLINKSISEVILPNFSEQTATDFSYCFALRKVTVVGDNNLFYSAADSYGDVPRSITFCPLWNEVEFAEGVTKVNGLYAYSPVWKHDKITYPSTLKYIPISLTCFNEDTGESYSSGSTRIINYCYTLNSKVLVCKAIVPPVAENIGKMTYDTVNKWYHYVDNSWSSGPRVYYYKVNVPSDAVLYVPSESIEAYRNAPIWDNFTNILPLESLEE